MELPSTVQDWILALSFHISPISGRIEHFTSNNYISACYIMEREYFQRYHERLFNTTFDKWFYFPNSPSVEKFFEAIRRYFDDDFVYKQTVYNRLFVEGFIDK